MTSFEGVVVVRTTVDSESAARALAGELVRARLAACAQWWPIRSTYRWKGEVEESAEFAVSAKTRASQGDAVVRFIREHHEYELPEILILPVDGGLPAYLDWIRAESAGTPTA